MSVFEKGQSKDRRPSARRAQQNRPGLLEALSKHFDEARRGCNQDLCGRAPAEYCKMLARFFRKNLRLPKPNWQSIPDERT